MNLLVEFHRPDTLKNPLSNYNKLISTLLNKIGKEQLLNRLEIISYKWAFESGYYYKKINDRHIFIHVSLNPNDFN